MSPQSDKGNNDPPNRWQKTERRLLMITVFFTVIGTFFSVIGTCYSVRTAKKALYQAEITLRPWIAFQKVNTNVKTTHLETNIELTNIGQVPAYLQVIVSASFDDQSIQPVESLKYVLLPGQSILQDGLTIKDDLFQAFRNGPGDHRITQLVQVRYGTDKEDLRYESVRKVSLTSEQFKQILDSPSLPGVWKLVQDDFK